MKSYIYQAKRPSFDSHREGMLSWCKRELQPENIADREEQFRREAELMQRLDEERAENIARYAEADRIDAELVAAYCTDYDHHDARLK